MPKISPESIGYAYEIQENISWKEIRESYSDEVCLWLWAGGDGASGDSTCFALMEYHNHTRLLQKTVSQASPARASISTLLDAILRIRSRCRICLISAIQIGTSTALKGKSKNQDLFDRVFELLLQQDCTLTEVFFPGGSDEVCSRICEADKAGSASAFFEERLQKRSKNSRSDLLNYRAQVEHILLRHQVPENILEEIRRIPLPDSMDPKSPL